MSSSDEIKVWRRSVPEGTYGGEYPCVKVRFKHHIQKFNLLHIIYNYIKKIHLLKMK